MNKIENYDINYHLIKSLLRNRIFTQSQRVFPQILKNCKERMEERRRKRNRKELCMSLCIYACQCTQRIVTSRSRSAESKNKCFLIYYPVMYCYIPLRSVNAFPPPVYKRTCFLLTASQIEWVLDFQQCDK